MLNGPAQAVAPGGSVGEVRVAPRVLPFVRTLLDRFAQRPEYQRHLTHRRSHASLTDFLLLTPDDKPTPEAVFPRLRWGGQCCFVSPHRKQVQELAASMGGDGFTVEEGPTFVREAWPWLPLPFVGRKSHYLVARKTRLIRPGEFTERFTYHVELKHAPGANQQPLIVQKEVPSLEALVAKLRNKFPEVPVETLERRGRKFTDKIFPTFLTREAGILMILQEHLPAQYAKRVPHVIRVEKDERGFVRRLQMNWLRNGRDGGSPLSQMEFAHQSADLLRVVHDVARVIHLDLRLDNMVITDDGVGFVDFGSSVRDDEDLSRNPLLATLFDDLMRTSQIQKMLTQMTTSGHVTSEVISNSRQKVDKAVDFFYLALQFNSPHANPDLADLIQYEPGSRDAEKLSQLTEQILRPADPAKPTFRSAKDILHGIERMQLGLRQRK